MLLSISAAVVGKKKELSPYQFKIYFKLDVKLVEILFKRVRTIFPCSIEHLLWTLYYLKTRNPNDMEISSIFRIDQDTLHFHVTRTLRKLLHVLPEVQKCFLFTKNNFISLISKTDFKTGDFCNLLA
jgi:hypothetical protein